MCTLSFPSSVTQVAPEIYLGQLPLQLSCPQASREHLLSDESTCFFACSVICSSAWPWLGWGALWWSESPHLDLFDPPPGVQQPAELLTVHPGSCRALSLVEVKPLNRSAQHLALIMHSATSSLMDHQQSTWEGREMQGLFSNPDPAQRAESQGISSC